jgi:DNA-binding response OmpR family regulator
VFRFAGRLQRAWGGGLGKKEKPDPLALDLTLPDLNGLEVMRTIRAGSPSTDVPVLTMHTSEDLPQEVLHCGALGYVLRSDADTEFTSTLGVSTRTIDSQRNKIMHKMKFASFILPLELHIRLVFPAAHNSLIYMLPSIGSASHSLYSCVG